MLITAKYFNGLKLVKVYFCHFKKNLEVMVAVNSVAAENVIRALRLFSGY